MKIVNFLRPPNLTLLLSKYSVSVSTPLEVCMALEGLTLGKAEHLLRHQSYHFPVFDEYAVMFLLPELSYYSRPFVLSIMLCTPSVFTLTNHTKFSSADDQESFPLPFS